MVVFILGFFWFVILEFYLMFFVVFCILYFKNIRLINLFCLVELVLIFRKLDLIVNF